MFDYAYDAEGRLVREESISTGEAVEYAWDSRGQLVEAVFKDAFGVVTKRVAYQYDALGRKVGKQVDDDGDNDFDRATRYVYDSAGKADSNGIGGLDDVVLVFDDSGSLTNRYLHGAGVDEILADEDALNEVLWGLADHLGTVRDLARYDAGTETTTIASHRTFDSFGNLLSETDPATNAPIAPASAEGRFLYQFTGREYDADTQLHYYRARWYHARLGRFLTEDPLSFAAGDANLGRYVGNQVTTHVDPSGLDDFMMAGVRPYEAPASSRPVKNAPGIAAYMPAEYPFTLRAEEFEKYARQLESEGNFTEASNVRQYIDQQWSKYHGNHSPLVSGPPSAAERLNQTYTMRLLREGEKEIQKHGGNAVNPLSIGFIPYQILIGSGGTAVELGHVAISAGAEEAIESFDRSIENSKSGFEKGMFYFGKGLTRAGQLSAECSLAITGSALTGGARGWNISPNRVLAWRLGSNHSAQQWSSKMAKRGWTHQQIDEALARGNQYAASNLVNPSNPATRFVHPVTGRSVVRDNVTGEIIHVGGDGYVY